jgi:hypothetical protein
VDGVCKQRLGKQRDEARAALYLRQPLQGARSRRLQGGGSTGRGGERSTPALSRECSTHNGCRGTYRVETGAFADENVNVLTCANKRGAELRRANASDDGTSAGNCEIKNSPASDTVPKPLPTTATHTPPYLPKAKINATKKLDRARRDARFEVNHQGDDTGCSTASPWGCSCARSMASTAAVLSLKFVTREMRRSLLGAAACSLVRWADTAALPPRMCSSALEGDIKPPFGRSKLLSFIFSLKTRCHSRPLQRVTVTRRAAQPRRRLTCVACAPAPRGTRPRAAAPRAKCRHRTRARGRNGICARDGKRRGPPAAATRRWRGGTRRLRPRR